MRPRHRAARKQQDQRIHERQAECREGLDTFGRPDTPRKVVGEFFWEQACFEECPEECDEEHHLGADKERHTVAQAKLHDRRMMPFDFGFPNDVAPPNKHGVEY